MLANYHTHTVFCDGDNTAEEVVLSAIDKGFDAIGFSSHGYTDFDLCYCMKDILAYIEEIKRLKEKYKNKIQVYLGVEEDIFCHANRDDFDYIIGSSHYFCNGGRYYSIDSDCESFKECLELFDYDVIALAETYYSSFCNYIAKRKPDIVGHFDLITKFDESGTPKFLDNPEYLKTSEKYIAQAAQNDVIFEVNTGAISRGYRKTPYPHENLLYTLKKCGAKLILSSDSHSKETLDFAFEETKQHLRYIGFDGVYVLHNGEFVKTTL